MADAIPFIARSEHLTADNMTDFVRFCRDDLTIFGPEFDFDAVTWDVTSHYYMRGKTHRMLLNFVETTPRRGLDRTPMPEPFVSQAKACVRFCAATGRRRVTPPYLMVIALRELLSAFQKKSLTPDLRLIDAHILDAAVDLAVARCSTNYGAGVGVELQRLSRLLRGKNLAVDAPFDWKHGQVWSQQTKAALSGAAAGRRAISLPSKEALEALPEAFRRASDTGDVIATSVMALLSCAPSRINEIFALPVDCELMPLVDGEKGYMLRWSGSKGYPDFIKGIPTVMADVAKEAIERLKTATNPARKISKWYELNPDKIYLEGSLESYRGRDLTGKDIAEIVGLSSPRRGRDWALWHKLTPIEGTRAPSGHHVSTFRFADVERAVLSRLPKDFPVLDKATGLKYSDALMVVRLYEFTNGGHTPSRCILAPVRYDNVMQRFRANDGIFARLGLCSPDDPIILRSHQLRHHLNTLAQRGGLSEFEIASWSGRKDIRQNAFYDHRSPEEMLERRRLRDKELACISGSAVRINNPSLRSEGFGQTGHGHVTEIGFCEQDLASVPCLMFMDCIRCTKHVCVKGLDQRHQERVSFSLQCARQSLAKAEEALASGYEVSEEWFSAHKETIDRLQQLQNLLADPSVPDGSLIRLSKSGCYTLVEQAIRDHEEATDAVLTWDRFVEIPES